MINGKLIERLNSNNRGFSLIELVVAVAVVSIVSTSLLQMFVTSARGAMMVTNLDNANVVVQSSLDLFKLDPNPEEFFKAGLGWDETPDESEYTDITRSTYEGSKNFLSDWTEWNESSINFPRYRLEVAINKALTDVETPNVQDDYVAEINAINQATATITIDKVGENYNVTSALGTGTGAVADYSSVIPIEIMTNSAINLTIMNNVSDKLIKIYVKNSEGFEATLNSDDSTIGGGVRITDSVSIQESNFEYSITSSVTNIDTGETILEGTSEKYNGID